LAYDHNWDTPHPLEVANSAAYDTIDGIAFSLLRGRQRTVTGNQVLSKHGHCAPEITESPPSSRAFRWAMKTLIGGAQLGLTALSMELDFGC
jgi:hypothetical protein